jgi:hypothetical protein
METINNGVLILSANRESAEAHRLSFKTVMESLTNEGVERFIGDACAEVFESGKTTALNDVLSICHNVQTIGGAAVAGVLQSAFSGVLTVKKNQLGYTASVTKKHIAAMTAEKTVNDLTAPVWQHRLKAKLVSTVLVKNRKAAPAAKRTYAERQTALYLEALKAGTTQTELMTQQESLISAALVQYQEFLAKKAK